MHRRTCLLGAVLLLVAVGTQAAKPLRILAFGDSITEGWVHTAWTKTPYTWRLEELLRSKYPGRQIELVNGGIGSAGVLDRLRPAWYQHMADAKQQGKRWSHVIFLAGINDVWMYGHAASEAFAVMPAMWKAATSQGANVLVIPPLPTNMSSSDAHEVNRVKLVGLITKYVTQQQKEGKPLALMSLEKTFGPYYSLPAAKRSKLYDDGLHLTPGGYQTLADLIFARLGKLIK